MRNFRHTFGGVEPVSTFAVSIGTIIARSSNAFGWLAAATDTNRRSNRDGTPASAFVVLGHAVGIGSDGTPSLLLAQSAIVPQHAHEATTLRCGKTARRSFRGHHSVATLVFTSPPCQKAGNAVATRPCQSKGQNGQRAITSISRPGTEARSNAPLVTKVHNRSRTALNQCHVQRSEEAGGGR